MNLDQARQRAEKSFRKEERARDGRAAMTEYQAQALAIRAKTARLKELRLAKEAETRSIIVLAPSPAKPPTLLRQRTRRAQRAMPQSPNLRP